MEVTNQKLATAKQLLVALQFEKENFDSVAPTPMNLDDPASVILKLTSTLQALMQQSPGALDMATGVLQSLSGEAIAACTATVAPPCTAAEAASTAGRVLKPRDSRERTPPRGCKDSAHANQKQEKDKEKDKETVATICAGSHVNQWKVSIGGTARVQGHPTFEDETVTVLRYLPDGLVQYA